MTRILDRVPDGVRNRLDSWEWWVGVAYFALAGVIVALFFLNARTTRSVAHTAKLEAIREAETQTTYQTCLASIPEFHRLSRHVAGVNHLAETLVKNSEAAIRAAPPGDPLMASRKANLKRLKTATAEIAAVTAFPAQTVAECAARRDAIQRG